MTQQNPIPNELSSGRGDRLIRVLVLNQKGNGFTPTTFSETEVERVIGIGKDHSALVLRSGVEIPVALPYEQLEQTFYQPDFKHDGPVLDLRDVTREELKTLGEKMLDGTIYAGMSPETHKPMYATPADASLTMSFNDARKYAAKLDAHGHRDWRVPTKNELNALFNNRAAIGGFNLTGSADGGIYWSSSQSFGVNSWGQAFRDGEQIDQDKYCNWAVRCVR